MTDKVILKVFAHPGDSTQQVGGACPEGWVQMNAQRPDDKSIARADGLWADPLLVYPRFYGNEKLDLFTQTEQLAVVTSTMADPQVKLMYDRLLGAAFLSYEDPETEQGLQLLVAKGLLTQERKAQIVSAMTREGA